MIPSLIYFLLFLWLWVTFSLVALDKISSHVHYLSQIVWNEEKKRWENKDGDEEVNSPPPPPPKFGMGGSGPPPMSMSRGGPKSG